MTMKQGKNKGLKKQALKSAKEIIVSERKEAKSGIIVILKQINNFLQNKQEFISNFLKNYQKII